MSTPNQESAPSSGEVLRVWYGKLPAHWTQTPARAIFSEVKSVGHDGQPMLSVTIGRGVIPQATLLAGSAKKDSSNLDKSKYKLVEVGDIAYNKMRAWQGAVGRSKYRGIVSPAYVVVRPRHANARYLESLMRTPAFAKEAERWSYGITSDMWSLRPEHFKMIYFPIPPADEQAAIVKYLGHAHERIDRAISAKRKLIALLEEQKQAIIHEAVTRGLDPTAPLKGSGIPWLGQIPAHWDEVRLRSVAEMRVSSIDKVPSPTERPVRLCNYVDVYKNDILDDSLPYMSGTATDHEIARYRLRSGDVLITKDSEDWRDIGVPALVITPGSDLVSGYHLAILRSDPKRLIGEYLLRALQTRAIAAQLHVRANGVTRYGLQHGVIKSLLLPLPSASEQESIVAHIAEATERARETQSRATREIDLLREFRTRLTSDVVTGQVDVREIASTLPELNEDMLATGDVDTGDSIEDTAEEFMEGETD